MQFKADLHLHCGDGEIQDPWTPQSKDIIGHAKSLGFNLLSFPCHNKVFYNEDLAEYAEKQGILLIPGVERDIEGKHVLIYNINNREAQQVRTFNDLRQLKQKRKNVLIIAPHPFFFHEACLGEKLLPNLDVFDAIEYSHFYTFWLNRNKQAVELAEKRSKPLVGTSDCHFLNQIGYTYSLIEAEDDITSILHSIRQNKIELRTKALPSTQFIKIGSKLFRA